MKHPIKSVIKALALGIGVLLSHIPHGAQASQVVINPVDDGSIYSSGAVITFAYLMPSGDIRGVAEFPTSSIPGPISQALLSVNPYGLPLWGPIVQVFGYESNDGQLTFSDYDAGTFLGNWVLPLALGYGEDAFLDVTPFLSGISSPYVGFNLRTESGGTDVFSSLEYNYGHPAQLIVSSVPEPHGIALILSGIAALGLTVWHQKRNRRQPSTRVFWRS